MHKQLFYDCMEQARAYYEDKIKNQVSPLTYYMDAFLYLAWIFESELLDKNIRFLTFESLQNELEKFTATVKEKQTHVNLKLFKNAINLAFMSYLKPKPLSLNFDEALAKHRDHLAVRALKEQAEIKEQILQASQLPTPSPERIARTYIVGQQLVIQRAKDEYAKRNFYRNLLLAQIHTAAQQPSLPKALMTLEEQQLILISKFDPEDKFIKSPPLSTRARAYYQSRKYILEEELYKLSIEDTYLESKKAIQLKNSLETITHILNRSLSQAAERRLKELYEKPVEFKDPPFLILDEAVAEEDKIIGELEKSPRLARAKEREQETDTSINLEHELHHQRLNNVTALMGSIVKAESYLSTEIVVPLPGVPDEKHRVEPSTLEIAADSISNPAVSVAQAALTFFPPPQSRSEPIKKRRKPFCACM